MLLRNYMKIKNYDEKGETLGDFLRVFDTIFDEICSRFLRFIQHEPIFQFRVLCFEFTISN